MVLFGRMRQPTNQCCVVVDTPIIILVLLLALAAAAATAITAVCSEVK